MTALGFEREKVIKSGDAIHAARRQLKVPRNKVQKIRLQEPKQLLSRMQDLNQSILAKLMPLPPLIIALSSGSKNGAGRMMRVSWIMIFSSFFTR